MALEIPPPFCTIADVEAGLALLERQFLARGDNRGAFVTTYLASTRTQLRWLTENRFGDGSWIARAMVTFANLYRAALENYEQRRLRLVPEAWRQAFEAGRSGTWSALQGLLLSINAHVNHDLPFALAEIGVRNDGESRLDDHTRMNEALGDATPEVRERVTTWYAPRLWTAGRLLGRLIDWIVARLLAAHRHRAWEHAMRLATAASEAERICMATEIQDRAATIGRRLFARRATAEFEATAPMTVEAA